MKYFFVLIIISMVAFCIFTFPVFNMSATETYLISPDDFLCDKILINSEKWQTKEFFVYKLDKNEISQARLIPNGKIIKEYIFQNDNTFKCNPFLECAFSGGQSVIGFPHIID